MSTTLAKESVVTNKGEICPCCAFFRTELSLGNINDRSIYRYLEWSRDAKKLTTNSQSMEIFKKMNGVKDVLMEYVEFLTKMIHYSKLTRIQNNFKILFFLFFTNFTLF